MPNVILYLMFLRRRKFSLSFARFEFLKVVPLMIRTSWDVTPYRLITDISKDLNPFLFRVKQADARKVCDCLPI